MDICLIFLALSFLIADGVFGDTGEVKTVSVMEGDSLTLHTDVIKQKDDVMVWSYGPENTLLATINGKAGSKMVSDDERFRDRLMLNNQTGDLTITNIRSEHTGLYTLKISSNNKISYKKFNVTVYTRLNNLTSSQTKHPNITDSDDPASRSIIITAVVVPVLCVIFIIFIIIISVFIHRREGLKGLMKSSDGKTSLNDEERSTNSSSTCEDAEDSKCLSIAYASEL